MLKLLREEESKVVKEEGGSTKTAKSIADELVLEWWPMFFGMFASSKGE